MAIPEIWLSKKMIGLLLKMTFDPISGVVTSVGTIHYASATCLRSYWEHRATQTDHLCARNTNLKCIAANIVASMPSRWERAQRFMMFLTTWSEKTSTPKKHMAKPTNRARLVLNYIKLSWPK